MESDRATRLQNNLRSLLGTGQVALGRELPERVLSGALSAADIRIDGARPWDPRIRRDRALRRILAWGSLGAGESYVDGDWDCDALDELIFRIMSTRVDESRALRSLFYFGEILAHVGNRQTVSRAARNARAHYDLSNHLYEAMLGRTMAYSCGYWRDATTLDEAQDAKHDLVCRKLGLEPGMRVLDIGCGWGGFARFAAERYQVQVVGVTVSPPQADFARRHCAALPVEIRLQDYRALSGHFDRVVSIGMFEHVGPGNYRVFFDTVRQVLDPAGLFLLQSVGVLESQAETDVWMGRYIFPNAVLPSQRQISHATERLFVLEDLHNFGADYDRTLMAWYAHFEAAWPELKSQHDERFYRMWRYYLLSCAGTFRARRSQLWQMVFSPRGVRGGYRRTGT